MRKHKNHKGKDKRCKIIVIGELGKDGAPHRHPDQLAKATTQMQKATERKLKNLGHSQQKRERNNELFIEDAFQKLGRGSKQMFAKI